MTFPSTARKLALALGLVALALTACEVDPDDVKASLCDKLVTLCQRSSYSSPDACAAAFEGTESCRLDCAEKQTTCDALDECLYPAVGLGGRVDTYCGTAQPEPATEVVDDTSGPDDKTGGVCYFQYNDGTAGGFGCKAGVDTRPLCEAWVLERTLNGASLIQWDWLPECVEIGCQMGCGPSWWSLY